MKKIAVKCQNKRQYDLVVQFNKNSGFKNTSGLDGVFIGVETHYITIGAHYTTKTNPNEVLHAFKVIDFETWAGCVNIELPKEDVIVKLATNEDCKVNRQGVDFDEPLQSLSGRAIESIYQAYQSLQGE
jgi:hypothetical protein